MDLSSIINFSKKNYMVVVSIVIILGCGVFMIMKMGEREFLDSRYRDLSIEHGRILKNLKYGKGLDEDLKVLEGLTKEAESYLFDVKDLAGNYDYFYKLESETGVKLAAMRQLDLSTANSRSVEARKSRRSKYSKIGYDMSVIGTFDQLVNFLRSLEGGKAHYQMQRIVVNVPTSEGTLKNHLQMNLAVKMLGIKAK